MRPVDRGQAPQVFSDYRHAAPYLKVQLGSYCSYCERWLASSLAVEHKSPKSIDPKKELDWENFLLACANCNSSKQTTPFVEGQYLWPDIDNTFDALTYSENGSVKPNPLAAQVVQNRAQALLNLVGLDKAPKDAETCIRMKQRREAWGKAVHLKSLYRNNSLAMNAETLCLVAKERGFWSVWMTVFADDLGICRHLEESFPGTATEQTWLRRRASIPSNVQTNSHRAL